MQKNIIEERIPTTMNMKQTFLYRALQREKGVRRQLFLTELSRALATLGACGTASLATSQVFLEKGSLSTTAPVLLVLFLMLGSLHLLGLRQAHLLQALSDGVRASVRQKLHLHLLSRQGQTDRTLTRRLLPLALESTDALDAWFTRVLPVVQGIAITMPCLLIAAFLVDPMTGLLMLVTVPIAPFLLYLIGRVTRKASEEQWREMNRFSAGLAEILRAPPTLKLFSREQAERERNGSVHPDSLVIGATARQVTTANGCLTGMGFPSRSTASSPLPFRPPFEPRTASITALARERTIETLSNPISSTHS